jgi:CRP-like cAMP-binding protein
VFEKIRAYFERSVPITDEQFEFIKTQFTPRKVKKGEFLVREGDFSNFGIFVASGCLRTYVIDEDGKEHILQFSVEDWWTGDRNSMLNKAPATCFIDALEDSEVLLFNDIAFQKLMDYIPGVASQYMKGLQKHTAAKDQRLVESISASAEQRYESFLKTYPSIAQRVPQHMIASYLGISPETLSRIRKQRTKKR